MNSHRGASALLLTLLLGCATSSAPGVAPQQPAGLGAQAGPATPAAAPTSPPERTPPPAALELAPAAAPPMLERQLRNGLRVVIIEQHRRPVVAVRLIFPRGAAGDVRGVEGATFLAVALASDFREIGEDGREIPAEKSFRRQVVDIGGGYTFDVGADHSTVGIAGYASDTKKYLAMLADSVQHLRNGERSFAGRRDGMLDALEDLELADSATFGRYLSQASFGEGHPYSQPVIGTQRSLSAMGLEDVVQAQARLFRPRGATLLVVGDVKAQEIVTQVERSFGGWQGEAPTTVHVEAPRLPKRAEIGFIKRQPASTLITCASRALPDVRGNDAALELLATSLGHGLNSRLAKVLRDAHGLTYGASAELVKRKHARALIVCSHLKAQEAELGVQLFRDALEAARTGTFTEEELRRAKALRLAQLESSYDDLQSSVRTWETALALGDRQPQLDAEKAALEKVTVEDVQKLAAKVLVPKTLRWIVSGEQAAASNAVAKSRLGAMRALTVSR